jgi:hypothetical protein
MNQASPLPVTVRPLLTDLIVILSIVLIGVVGYKLSPLLVPKADRTVAPEAGCNLHREACEVKLRSGKLSLKIAPQPIPLVKPIQLEVLTEGLAIRRIDADFAGVGMNMGLNRPQLQPQGEDRYVATTSLPVCITNTMRWELTLLVETETEQILIPFRFSTPDDGNGS